MLNKIIKYKIVSIVSTKSHNINIILRQRFSNKLWVGKFSKFLKDCFETTDLNNRAILAYRLNRKFNELIPKTIIINTDQIVQNPFSDKYREYISNKGDEIISQGEVLLSEFKGVGLNKFKEVAEIKEINNLDAILNNFVFDLWIGNYDKKDEDYVVDDELNCYSIDYNLWGPGFVDDNVSLGAYAQSYSLQDTADTGWAIAEIFRKYIVENKLKIDFFEESIQKVENFSDLEIRKSFDGLNFYRQSSEEIIKEVFIEFLIKRKKKIRIAISNWIENGYTKGERPKNPQNEA